MKNIKLIEVIYDAHKVEPCDKVKSEIQEIIENHINEFNKYYEVNKLDDSVEIDHDLLKLFVSKVLYTTYKYYSRLIYDPLEVTLISEIIMYGRIIKIKIGIK